MPCCFPHSRSPKSPCRMRAPMNRWPEARPPPAEISLPYKNVYYGGYFVGYTDSPSGAAGRQAAATAGIGGRRTAVRQRVICGLSYIHSWLRRIGLDPSAETFTAWDLDVAVLAELRSEEGRGGK